MSALNRQQNAMHVAARQKKGTISIARHSFRGVKEVVTSDIRKEKASPKKKTRQVIPNS